MMPLARTLDIQRRPLPHNYLAGSTGLYPVLERVYAARGVLDVRNIEPSMAALLPPAGMSGLAKAVDLLVDAIDQKQHIVIVGDFDADGATGTAVAIRGLKLLGAKQVSYQVPNRFTHGYGLSAALVHTLLQVAGPVPDLLITVDNGTSSIEGVAAAKAAGIKVLITDHHLPGIELPAADAIVNPCLPGESFASKALCGVGVMFYLLIALRAKLRQLGRYQSGTEPNLAQLLDLVALGTVADLVPLDRNNRILVEQGLRRLRQGYGTLGIRALMSTSGTNIRRLAASDFAFRIAPRLNAAGRLDDMSLGIECLLTDDPARARQMAEQLNSLNDDRKALQSDMQQQALMIVEQMVKKMRDVPAVLVLADPTWHQGVVGLVASKMVERFHRPTIALAPSDDGWRGSARSIAGFHLRDALARLDSLHPQLMTRFGGHAMAAGLSIAEDKLEAFQAAAEIELPGLVAPELLHKVVYTDGPIAPSDINLELAHAIRAGGPWGQQFPEPMFEIEGHILDAQTLSGGHLKLRVRTDDDQQFVAFWFGADMDAVSLPKRARLIAQIDVDDFRGLDQARLLVRYLIAL